jgi:antitoxin MazE
MRTVVKRRGNGAAVRIPASVVAAADVSLGQTVEVRAEAGCIVVEPIRVDCYDVGGLIAGITDENRHDAVDVGRPVGREAW